MSKLRINFNPFIIITLLIGIPSFAQEVSLAGVEESRPKLFGEMRSLVGKTITVKTTNVELLELKLRREGLSYTNPYGDYYQIEKAPLDFIETLVAAKHITYIGFESTTFKEEARVLDLNLVANQISNAKSDYPNIEGNSTYVHIKEPPVDAEDVDLLGRVDRLINNEDFNRHATAMATIIGGSGLSSNRGLGIMPNVNLVSSDLSTFFPDDQSFYESRIVDVENHSYGTTIESFYGGRASAFDEHLHLNRNLVTVFSAGNQGLSLSEIGAYAGIEGVANLTGNFKMAKNAIVVGAVDTVGRVISFNSSGPAHDGRIKPDLVAYSMEGTSNAAALVSGSAAFLKELYDSLFNAQATASLIKALLINGADDVHLKGPDFKTGFGNLNLDNSTSLLTDEQFQEGVINSNESLRFDLPKVQANSELKISLVWNDMAAEPNAIRALINDLDLYVVDPNGSIRLPFSPNANPNQLFEAAIEKEDHLNNVEQVLIENSIEGVYQIVIESNNLATSQQDFAFAFAIEEAEQFEWVYPFEEANMPFNGETIGYIRWQSSLPNEMVTLSYRMNGVGDWNFIGETSLLAQKLRWDPPQVHGVAEIRMQSASNTFYSERFTISRPVRFAPAVVCGDSIRFEMPEFPGIEYYQLKGFDNQGQEVQSLSFENGLTIESELQGLTYLTVAPRGPNGEEYLKSDLLTIDQIVGSCYLNSFFSEVRLDSGIVISAELGSINGLESVELYRDELLVDVLNLGEFSKSNKLIDADPLIGRNLHLVKLNFNNGQHLFSEELTSYFLPENEFLVFPNPIARGERLIFYQTSLVTQKATLYLNDARGKNFLIASFDQEQLVVDTSVLSRGIYIYSIVSNGERTRGKLIID